MDAFVDTLKRNGPFFLFDQLTAEVHIWKVVRNASGTVVTWRLVYVNPVALRTWGVDSLDEIQGQTTDEIFGPGASAHYLPVVRKIMSEGTPHTYRDHFEHLGKHFRFTTIPMGEYFITTGDDITEFMQAQESADLATQELDRLLKQRTAKLEASEDELRVIQEAHRIGRYGAFSWDLTTQAITWSDAFFQLIGRQPEAAHQTWEDFLTCVHPDDRSQVAHLADRVIAAGAHPPVQYRVLFPDGSIRYLVSEARLEYDEVGDPARMIGFAQDITQQRHYEAEIIQARNDAERASQAKSELLSMMSHELRTPLTTIIGPTDLLDLMLENQEAKDLLAIIKQSAEQLLVVINDVLNLTKAEAGALDVRKAPYEIRSVLPTLLRPLSASACAKGLEFHLSIADSVPAVMHTDARLLHQILLSLVGNAVKFTEDGAIRVEVTSAPHQDQTCRFTVRDTGPGIPSHAYGQIFEPFYQTDMSFNRKHEGSGLGLAIAATFTDLLGGTLAVESEESTGSAFTLTLPLGVADNLQVQDNEPEQSPTPHVALPDRRLLVVEDYPGTQFLIKTMLEQMDMTFDLVDTGEEAVALFEKQPYDLVLMDIRLPGIDGIEAMKRIRAHASDTQQPYIIAQTAYALTQESERIRASGVDDLLSKPFTFQEFRRVVEKALRTMTP